MSGRTKRILYITVSVVLALCAAAGTALLLAFAVMQGGPLQEKGVSVWVSVGVALFVIVIFPLNLILHELGHVLSGLLCWLFPVSVKIGYVTFARNRVSFSLDTDVDGMSAMLSRKQTHLREKLAVCALGGAALNLIYGIVFLVLWFIFPSPAMLFFVLLAPVNLYEGIAALIPAQRTAGATDGALFVGLLKRQPFAEVMLAIVKTQSTLVKGTFADVERDWLFSTPVIREDDVLFLALTQLRWQYLFCRNDEKGAIEQLKRLEDIFEYHPDADAACDLAYAYAVFMPDGERADFYMEQAKGAKGSLAYDCACAACGREELAKACGRAEKEKWVGLRELSFRLIDRIPHVI